MIPLHARVVVKQSEAETKTSGGIIIPESSQEKPRLGEVKAVGPGRPGEPMTVKVGDTVMFGKYTGTEFPTDEWGNCLILVESDILAIINPTTNEGNN